MWGCGGNRYRQGTRSSGARDATAVDRLSTSDAVVFDVPGAKWGGGGSPLAVLCSAHHVNGYQRSASLLSNGQSVLPYLTRPALKAAKMFSSGKRWTPLCSDLCLCACIV